MLLNFVIMGQEMQFLNDYINLLIVTRGSNHIKFTKGREKLPRRLNFNLALRRSAACGS